MEAPYQLGSLYEVEQLSMRTTGKIPTETF
jgi:hypothetical protein